MSTKSAIERAGARKPTTPQRSSTSIPRPRSSSTGRLNIQSEPSTPPRTPNYRGRPTRPGSRSVEKAKETLSDNDIRSYIANRNVSQERPSPQGRLYSKSQTRERDPGPLGTTSRRDRSMSPGPLRARTPTATPVESPKSFKDRTRPSTGRSSSVDALTRAHSSMGQHKSVLIGLKSPGSPSSFMSKTHSARGTVKIEGIHHHPHRNAELLKKFGEYRLQGRLIDLTLGFFGGLEIKCHRVVLAAASPYFKSLLSSGNRHVTRHDFIQMRGVQYSVMDILVDYAYSGTVAGVERDMLESLSESSKVFKFKDIHEACRSYLSKERKTLKSRTISSRNRTIDTLSEDGSYHDYSLSSPMKSDADSRADEDSGQESASENPGPAERLSFVKDRSRNDSGNGSREEARSSSVISSSAELSPPDFSFSNPKHANEIMKEINRTRREAILFDVVLRTQTKDFPCQRLVLETGSPYLSHLITQELAGSKHMDVFLTRIPPDILQKLVLYLYTGKMEITEKDVRKIYKCASKFQLQEVCDACATLDDTLDSTKSVASEKTTLTNPE